MTVPFDTLGHHGQEVITGEIRQAEHFLWAHTQLTPYLLYRLTIIQQSLDDGFHRLQQMCAASAVVCDGAVDVLGCVLVAHHHDRYFAAENGTALTGEYYQLESAINGYRDEMYEAERTIENLNKAIEADAEAVAAAEAEIESAQAAVEQLTGVTEEQAAAEAEATRQTQELQGIIEDVTGQMSALTEAYNEAYGAALDSISGQYALWDEAAKVVETSAGSINNALESQITYWQDYNANLQSLTERSADIEGLGAVIASFADGSENSVNAIAGLANASDEDLRAMVTNWQELQKEQEAAAGSVADLKTDFSATMDELQQELAADIEAMDLGDEAAASGRATIQGYIDAANDMLPEVQAAYKALAQAASNAMGTPSYINSAWYVSGNRGYATGTESAEPGWAKAFNMNHWGNWNRGGWKGCDLRYDILGSTNKAPSGYGSAAQAGRTGYDPVSYDIVNSPVANTLAAAFPKDVRKVLKTVTKYTDNVGNASGDTAGNVTDSVDYFYLLAEHEVYGGSRTYANSYEKNYQAQYDYFKAGNSKQLYKHDARTTAVWGRLRSPNYNNNNNFSAVGSGAGGGVNNYNANNSGGLFAGFC